MSEAEIQSITFEPGGVVITYMTPDDIRIGGMVARASQLNVSFRHPDYREDIEAINRKAQRFLSNVLEDFADSEAYEPDDELEMPDGTPIGMGEHR